MTELTFHQEDYKTDYLTLPKQMDKTDPRVLLVLADRHVLLAHESQSPKVRSNHSRIAASAMIEATLMDHDPEHADDDYRLECIDDAAKLLLEAVQCESEILERCLNEDMDQLLRTELALDFINLYKDMVCGEITTYTVEELLRALKGRLERVDKLERVKNIPEDFKRHLVGLKSELIVLHNTWSQYNEYGDLVVIPSTYRGGDGRHRKDETHDLVFLQQDDDTAFDIVKEAEVKTEFAANAEERRLRSLGRYSCELIIVGRNGNIRTLPSIVSRAQMKEAS